MFQILMLTDADGPSASVLPALDLLNHKVSVAPTRTVSGSLDGRSPDVVLLDGRTDLITARNLAQLLTAKGLAAPLLMVLTEGGMAAVAANWSGRSGSSAGRSCSQLRSCTWCWPRSTRAC